MGFLIIHCEQCLDAEIVKWSSFRVVVWDIC